ncbi:MAG: Nre family DNA repair protein [Candidatus Thermoplasmatota archaeon]|nr:Nre family DNA repair protein [Candidatus Thermoplasmatota archaeon]
MRDSYKCILCRGGRNLCGKDFCPVIVKNRAYAKTLPMLSNELQGSTPPGIFVGRYGYPKVYIGPLIPPYTGNTSQLDTPELWYGKSIEEIVSFRTSLVRGEYPARVDAIEQRDIREIRELALAEASFDLHAKFLKKPNMRIILDDNSQPFGPSAPIDKLEAQNFRTNPLLERVYYDTDLRAVDGVVELYERGAFISQIEKAFSAGLIGKKRKLVPTRWSITAVDDTVSKALREEIKGYETIDKFLVYRLDALDNRWQILMLPSTWRYELIEAWYPKTLWNPYSSKVEIFGDHEFYEGRKSYAAIGGCYYASRLAVTESLHNMRRQAGAVVMREAHPGYVLPVGVWNVREHVRRALRSKPGEFDTLEQALSYVSHHFDIPLKRWIDTSAIIKDMKAQRRIDEFI